MPLQNVLKFWIIRGVDGFRVDAAVHIVKHNEFKDEPRSKNEKVTKVPFVEHLSLNLITCKEVSACSSHSMFIGS